LVNQQGEQTRNLPAASPWDGSLASVLLLGSRLSSHCDEFEFVVCWEHHHVKDGLYKSLTFDIGRKASRERRRLASKAFFRFLTVLFIHIVPFFFALGTRFIFVFSQVEVPTFILPQGVPRRFEMQKDICRITPLKWERMA
jgi:hypothetical protein